MIDALLDHAPVIGLLFFFLFFCSVLIYLFMPGSKKKFDEFKYIPLREDKND
jgi:cbb3-type cytochrome oxidase subunit 3